MGRSRLIALILIKGRSAGRAYKVIGWSELKTEALSVHRHILIPTDGSDMSERAEEYGIALAKAIGARVTGLTVSTPAQLSGAIVDELLSPDDGTRVDRYLERIADCAARAGVSCNVVHVEHKHPYQAIVDTANDKGCDLIVMASHGRSGISAILLGSEARKVLTHSTVPVLVYPAARSGLFPPYFAAS
jgi:nucleotide-binding universal stress UspA family protein